MRILFFSSYFLPYLSGLTVYPYRILKQLSKSNSVKVLTFPHKQNLKKVEQMDSLLIVRVPYLFQVSKGYISPQSLPVFFREAERADIVILTMPNVEGLFLAIVARMMGKPLILIYLCSPVFTGGLFASIVTLVLRASAILQVSLATAIFAIPDYIQSQSVFNQLKKKLIPALPPIEKKTISQSTFASHLKQKGEKKWIGFVGRVSSEKGIEYLVEAISQLVNEANVELVFCGPSGPQVAGEKLYFQQIKTLLKQKKVPHRFLGMVDDEEIGAIYRSLDVLVLPSINQTEAFGMVQAEAMLAGTPVVASNSPGVRLPIKLTQMGLLVPPKNSTALADAISTVLKDKHRFANSALIAKAHEIFNPEKTYKAYVDLLRKITT